MTCVPFLWEHRIRRPTSKTHWSFYCTNPSIIACSRNSLSPPLPWVAAMSASRPTDAERWLSTAAKLLDARDFVGAKDFAERAMDFDPLLPGVDQILAAAAVLDAAKHRANNWYAILALDPSSASPADVKREYRRLALLLHPDSNKSAAAADAFRLVVEAHTVLSDPARKSLFDAELQIGRSNPPPPPAAGGGDPPFWTACPFCFHVYEFARVYHNRALRCPTCQRAFRAVETASPPAIVPGTDMYYCSWGFFPLGFSGGPGTDPAWKPFYPTSPYWGSQPGQPAVVPVQQPQPLFPTQGGVQPQPQPQPAAAAPTRKKVVARKRVGGGLQNVQSQPGPKSTWPGPEAWEDTKRPDEVMVVNPNGEVGILEGGKVNASVIRDIDAIDELLRDSAESSVPQ